MAFADLQDRLAALRAQLCPPLLYVQIQDQAVTAMALGGRQVLWLERLPLPEGVCRHGVPLVPVALGDLIGDWLLERGYGGAQVKAVLPPSACSWRVLDPPPAMGSADLHSWAEGMAEQLGLVWAEGGCLEAVDVLCEPLGEQPSKVLMVVVARALLEGWLEVFDQAGCSLAALQPACLCTWNGLVPLRQASVLPLGSPGLLMVETRQTWLFELSPQHPVTQWYLPCLDGVNEWLGSLRFLMQCDDCGGPERAVPAERQELLLVGDGSQADWMEPTLTPLSAASRGGVRLIDPLQMGWLGWQDTTSMAGGLQSMPWLLWGLAVPDLSPGPL